MRTFHKPHWNVSSSGDSSGDVVAQDTGIETGRQNTDVPESGSEMVPEEHVIESQKEWKHRAQVYNPPSWQVQMFAVARLELRQTYKAGRSFIPLLALGLMAALVLTGSSDYIIETVKDNGFRVFDRAYGATYTALVLFLLPLVVYYMSAHMSDTLPSDFKDNLACFYLAQPVSRSALYVGKFVAGYVPMVMITIMAYVLASAVTVGKGGVSTAVMLKSLVICLLSEFAMASMIFSMSASKNKGSVTRGFLVLMAAFPLLYLLLDNLEFLLQFAGASDNEVKDVSDGLSGLMPYLTYIPVFGPDIALLVMDGNGISTSMLGIANIVNSLFTESNFVYGYTHGVSIPVLCVIYILWGALFMRNGIRKYLRRELR